MRHLAILAILLAVFHAPVLASDKPRVAGLAPVEIASDASAADDQGPPRIVRFRECGLVCVQNHGTREGGVRCWEEHGVPEDIQDLMRKTGHSTHGLPKGEGK